MSEPPLQVLKPNEQVLAYHGPLIYNAKILKMHEKGKTFVVNGEGQHEPLLENEIPPHLLEEDTFLLHYLRWNLKWDEWVGKDRILDLNGPNLQLRSRVRQEYDVNKMSRIQASQGMVKKPKTSRKKVEKPETKVKKEQPVPKKKKHDIILPMPDKLKYVLVDDWELVTRDRKIVRVPCEKPVKAIIQEYLSYARQHRKRDELNIIKEIIPGLEKYFNEAAKLILLYKYERLQYGNLLKEYGSDIELSDYYGFEHLLRLFVSLPGMVAQTNMDAPSIQVLMKESNYMLEYLAQHINDYMNEYQNTTPAYDGLARS